MVQNASCLGAVDGACGSLFGGAGVGHRHWDYFASFDGLFQRKKEKIKIRFVFSAGRYSAGFLFFIFPKEKRSILLLRDEEEKIPIFRLSPKERTV